MKPIVMNKETANHEIYERIRLGELEPHCGQCSAKLEVRRFEGQPDGPIHLIRCPADPKHFMVSFSVESAEWEGLMGREPRA
jgi:hypothetical protein